MPSTSTERPLLHLDPTIAGTELIGIHDTYAGAHDQVEVLFKQDFPIQHVRILGAGLRSVEQVALPSAGRAALLGAASGAGTGLVTALLLALFATGEARIWAPIGAIVLGVTLGALFAALAHRTPPGRRTLITELQATCYEVYADTGVATEARRLAAGL